MIFVRGNKLESVFTFMPRFPEPKLHLILNLLQADKEHYNVSHTRMIISLGKVSIDTQLYMRNLRKEFPRNHKV